MHLFIGFIQLLLILTDSRFIPDMSSFWHHPVYTASSQSESFRFDYPTTMARPLSFDIIQQTGNDKLLLTPANADGNGIAMARNINQPSPRVIHTSKLYLIFCQLKTEG